MNKILREDIEAFSLPEEMRRALAGKTMVVTGATGLIGSLLVKTLCAQNLGIRFILPVRNKAKAEEIFGKWGTEGSPAMTNRDCIIGEKNDRREIKIWEGEVSRFFEERK